MHGKWAQPPNSSYITKPNAGSVLLPEAGEVALLFPRLSVVEEIGLSHCLPPSSLLRETAALKEGREKI